MIERMIEDVLKKEGGFVNHPNDKGGPTKYGITTKTLSNWFGRPATTEDVKHLHETTAKEIYKQNYYLTPKINVLPPEIQPFIFDSAVNHGPRRAIKFIQIVTNKAGFSNFKEDGIIGPKTKEASFRAFEEMQNYFINALVDERNNFYYDIVYNNPSQEVFLKGWLMRSESFRKET